MNKTKLCCLFITIISLNSATKAQEIATDNAGKPIFTIPSTNKIIWDVALNNLGINYTPFVFRKTRYYVMNGAAQQNTMYKSTSLNIKASVANNEEDILLIDNDLDIAPHFEVGINRTIDNLVNPSRIDKYYTFNLSVFTDHQSFKLYDTTAKKFMEDKYKRWSWGFKSSLNIFHRTTYALALNVSFKNSIVADDLTSVQDKSSNTVYSDNNIVTNGETDGYLAPANAISNWRVSIANPWFTKTKSGLTIIPYYFIKFGDIKPKHNAGVLFTFLKNPFKNFDINAATGAYDPNASYEFETAFSIGLNFLSTGTEKKNYLFLSGTVSFGKTSKTAGSSLGANNLF